ncbi:hypothetical protein KY336_02630, partial [Candidatus Woesearchaeota archaeon]|nr:hypothetical protein [Candidatus Woesearchaeota archaeon]
MKKAIEQYKIWFMIFGIIVLISPLLLRLANKNFTVSTTIPYYFLIKYGLSFLLFSIIPIVLTVITIYLIYRISLNIGIKKEIAELALLLYIFSVPVLYLANFLNDHTILLFLMALGFFFLTDKNKKFNKLFKTLAFIILLSTAYFGIFSLLAVAFLLVYHYSLQVNKLQKLLCKILIL